MPIPLPPVPSQAIVFLDALRGVRYAMRSGRRKLNEIHAKRTESPEKLAADILVRHINEISEDVDRLLSKAGEQLHPGGDNRWKSLSNILAAQPSVSSEYVYRSLKFVAHRFGYSESLISEASCVQALTPFHRSKAVGSNSFVIPAQLALRLVKVQPMLRMSGKGLIASDEAESLVIHAVVLALCAEGGGQSLIEMLSSAADIALATSSEIVAVYRNGNASQLECILAGYAHHV